MLLAGNAARHLVLFEIGGSPLGQLRILTSISDLVITPPLPFQEVGSLNSRLMLLLQVELHMEVEVQLVIQRQMELLLRKLILVLVGHTEMHNRQ